MKDNTEVNITAEKQKKSWWKIILEPTSALAITLFSLIIAFPIFVTFNAYIPPMRYESLGYFPLDFVIAFLLVFIILFILLRLYQKIFFLIVGLGFIGLLISHFSGNYGFNNLYYDYATVIYSFNEKIIQEHFKVEDNSFAKKDQILTAIDYRDEFVKAKANAWAIAHFSKYKKDVPSLKVLHCFSIFKEVRKRWNYVYDPIGPDYYSSTSSTLQQLVDDDKVKGDCDDYSILLAGLFTAVGGEVQLVRTKVETPTRTVGHLYPELKIGDKKDLDKYAYLIQNHLFLKESKDKLIYFYTDGNGDIWLNMDYNDFYPGGKYQSLVRKSVLKVE